MAFGRVVSPMDPGGGGGGGLFVALPLRGGAAPTATPVSHVVVGCCDEVWASADAVVVVVVWSIDQLLAIHGASLAVDGRSIKKGPSDCCWRCGSWAVWVAAVAITSRNYWVLMFSFSLLLLDS